MSASIPLKSSAKATISQALLGSFVPVRGRLAGTSVGVGTLLLVGMSAVAASSTVAVIAPVVGVGRSGVGVAGGGVECSGFGCRVGVLVALG